MNFTEYQHKARSTAIYPTKHRLIYPTLGLCGEAGEFAEKVKKLIRDNNEIMTPKLKDALAKELGDCLWYIANISCDLDISLEDVAIQNLEKLSDRKERGKLQGNGDDR